ncbi:hypothetical protein NDU88_002694 [Pleurodeles waltl]|uniref:Uncharacterized protein n=1 Tax=Pleurodeles waltl TaxID=8319 RepID=A0AAV7VF44_PLEWA|nr:hypothetical protein NDU88_002694 [Pleurodeles waltl]
MERELCTSIRADPAESRIGENKQKRGDPLPPSPSLGGICSINGAPGPEAWHQAGVDILGPHLLAAAHRSPFPPAEYTAELNLGTELRAGPQCSVWRPRADEAAPALGVHGTRSAHLRPG